MSDSLRFHGLQHTRLLCPSLSPRVCSNSCPLGWWCYLTISSAAAPLLLLLSIFPTIRVFSSELPLCIRWPNEWSVSVSPSNEYSGLISFRTDWLDLLVVQGTISLHQHHNLKALILQGSAFFIVQLPCMYGPYITTGSRAKSSGAKSSAKRKI